MLKDFPRTLRLASEEREGLDRPVQDRLGPLRGQRDGQRRVRVTPGDDQDWNLPPTVGVVDVDMPEVGLGPCPRPVLQRNERLAAIEPLLLEVTASRRDGGSRRWRTAPRIAGLVRATERKGGEEAGVWRPFTSHSATSAS